MRPKRRHLSKPSLQYYKAYSKTTHIFQLHFRFVCSRHSNDKPITCLCKISQTRFISSNKFSHTSSTCSYYQYYDGYFPQASKANSAPHILIIHIRNACRRRKTNSLNYAHTAFAASALMSNFATITVSLIIRIISTACPHCKPVTFPSAHFQPPLQVYDHGTPLHFPLQALDVSRSMIRTHARLFPPWPPQLRRQLTPT